jgi:hypothetical protein
MWGKLAVLGAAVVVVLFLLFAPLGTMTIRVDLPPAAAPAAGQQGKPVNVDTGAMTKVVGIVIVLAVVTAAGLIARRIVRRHTIKDDTFS